MATTLFKQLVNITPELRSVISHVAAETGETIGATIERLLRSSPESERARKRLGLTYSERTKQGWQGKKRNPPKNKSANA